MLFLHSFAELRFAPVNLASASILVKSEISLVGPLEDSSVGTSPSVPLLFAWSPRNPDLCLEIDLDRVLSRARREFIGFGSEAERI